MDGDVKKRPQLVVENIFEIDDLDISRPRGMGIGMTFCEDEVQNTGMVAG